MKVLIVFASFFTFAFAGYQQHYPINIPVIGKTGVPLESSEIVHTRLAHLSHVAAVKSNQGSAYYGLTNGYTNGYSGAVEYANPGYVGNAYYPQTHYPINIPVIGKTGVPLESAEIVHARHAHLSQVAAVRSQQGWNYDNAHYSGSYALPVIGNAGVPIDTPEVQAAKAAHFAAYAKAASGSHYRHRRSIYAGYGAYTYPKLGHYGQPIETPEVQVLKQKHFAAYAEALSRTGSGHNLWNNGAESYNNLSGYGSGIYGHGSIHIPVIGHNGVPLDTPEVQHARQQHIVALAEASSRASYSGYGNGLYF